MNKMKAWLSILSVISFLIFASSAHATTTTPFFDDFEDGDYTGWLETTTGGTGSFSVQDKNDSLMANVYHSGSHLHALSVDLAYTADAVLSFDMLAVAVSGGNGADAGSGVKISFLTSFNTSLADMTFTNRTNALGANEFAIDQSQHNYADEMYDYASFAGMSDDSGIAKIHLLFFAWAETTMRSTFAGPRYHSGSANVWFDNVSSSLVPVPGTLWLFFSGMIGIIGILRPKR